MTALNGSVSPVPASASDRRAPKVAEPRPAWRLESEQLRAERKPGTGQLLATIGAAGIFAPLEPIDYVIEPLDFCPGAVCLVAGYGFSGKTLALQSLALSIASGKPAFGCYPTTPGKVLHIDYEQGQRLTRDRYQRLARAMGLAPSDLEGSLELASLPPERLDSDKGMALLERSVEGCKLVVVDSLRACAPSLDENSSDIRRVLDDLTRVSDASGATVVVIHHARKPQKDAGSVAKTSIRGSGAIFDACGSVLVFEGRKSGVVRVTHEKARTSGVPADDFELLIEDVPDDGAQRPRAGLRVTAASTVRDVVNLNARHDQEVFELVLANPGCSGRQAIDSLAGTVPKRIVSAALERLRDAARVESRPGPKRSSTWWPV